MIRLPSLRDFPSDFLQTTYRHLVTETHSALKPLLHFNQCFCFSKSFTARASPLTRWRGTPQDVGRPNRRAAPLSLPDNDALRARIFLSNTLSRSSAVFVICFARRRGHRIRSLKFTRQSSDVKILLREGNFDSVFSKQVIDFQV